MKTKFFKFVLPIAFVAIGLAGALSTNAMEKGMAESGAVIGYKKISAVSCQITSTSCDQVQNFLCKAPDGTQLYHNIAPNQCPDMLYRSTQ